MNPTYATTGDIPLCIGSTEKFVVQAYANGLPWDLTGGSVQLLLADAAGNLTTINATIAGQGAYANWTVAAPAGRWTRAWKVEDAAGVIQYSVPKVFTVISSPA